MKADSNFLKKAGNILLPGVINFLAGTLRIEKVNFDKTRQLIKSGEGIAAVFWHGSMIAGWYVFRGKNSSALISASKDGEMLNGVLKNWKYKTIRGSSSKGGKEALEVLVNELKENRIVAITPDGPRGPYHEFKPGAVVAAKKSGKKLVLAGIDYKKKKQLKSWDKFEVPLPFSKVKMVFSDPIEINPELTFEETGELIKDCELKLKMLQEKAAEVA